MDFIRFHEELCGFVGGYGVAHGEGVSKKMRDSSWWSLKQDAVFLRGDDFSELWVGVASSRRKQIIYAPRKL